MPHIEAKEINDDHAPVRVCHRYLRNRLKQLDYAQWKIEHARNLLNLRVMRANGGWENYWRDFQYAT